MEEEAEAHPEARSLRRNQIRHSDAAQLSTQEPSAKREKQVNKKQYHPYRDPKLAALPRPSSHKKVLTVVHNLWLSP